MSSRLAVDFRAIADLAMISCAESLTDVANSVRKGSHDARTLGRVGVALTGAVDLLKEAANIAEGKDDKRKLERLCRLYGTKKRP